ncbi:LysR family transcriptional regulator [Streptomonospora sp. S1-112]|uniref:LysR family transcriptional regulator n=1 Tax=Streptomonospora mangrovi TaxID=2883123 RepID=A0A9X3NN35_9ACTN|nr:LysR family transcriptional regulator [Streptomonospora mangrovi]MDA0566782.1 LysR family transcriptional regulator [Streptomonospora mangrovi]
MDLTRLRLLVELERWGTMGAVAEVAGMSTSAVSKHFAVLEKEAGARLLAPEGRRVRLTPAGQRLARHAVDILARVEAAQAELAGEGEPVGRVSLVTFVSVATPIVLPAVRRLRDDHPGIDVRLIEHEPDDALRVLQSGAADLGLVYDYSLVPRRFPGTMTLRPLGTEPLLLSQPSAGPATSRTMTRARLRGLADASWIANSRGSDDDELVSRLCAGAGFAPLIRHRIDNLEMVEELVAAGMGVGVLPKLAAATRRGVVHSPLGELGGSRRIALAANTGAWAWRPILLLGRYLWQEARRVLDDAAPEPPAPPGPADFG